MIAVEWLPVPGVRALCTNRSGDFSTAQGRQQLRSVAALPAEPRWLRQVHGKAVADLDASSAEAPVADAAISAAPGTICAVLTADCLPVLLAAGDGSAVGAAHAGWRGLAAGVIESTVQALRSRLAPGATVLAFLGPAIAAANFEVGDEVRDAFLAVDAAADVAFVRNAGNRWQCDLYALARQRLAGLGITAVAGGGFCTYADSARFYSHRRDVQHHGLASTGRMAALIWRT